MRGDNIKMNYRKYSLTAFLLIISLFLIFQPVSAEFIAEEQDINLKLHNEFRHADRPSASAPYGPKIDAWVQSTLLDYKSGSVLGDMFGIEANLYNSGKLKANPNKATRFYLGGDDLHSSFSIAGAALTFDFGKKAQFKAGRFGVDPNHLDIFDNSVMPVTSASARPTPEMRQGAIWKGDFGKNLNLYGVYSKAHAGGYYTEWTDYSNYVTGEEEPKYTIGAVVDNEERKYTFGYDYQDDTYNQFFTTVEQSWQTENGAYIAAKGLAMYASALGSAEDDVANISLYDSDTYALSGQMSYTKNSHTFSFAVGKVGDKVHPLSGIETDVVYPFDMSIDRNNHQSWSYQPAYYYQLSKNTTAGAAMTFTDAYVNGTETTEVNGVGINLILNHTWTQEPINGLNSTLIFSKAREDRGTDTLDYYDINVDISYSFNF